MSAPRRSKAAVNAAAPPQGPQTEEYPFARFWRCALQVNPSKYQKTYRGLDHGLDPSSYNQAILEKCRELDIRVVGIADHGSVDSVDELGAVLRGGGIVVFPGFEIASTEKIHMVCLFAEDTTKDQLNRFLGKLDLTDPEDGVRPSHMGCLELAKTIHELDGFWYAAHATNNNGLIRLYQDGGGLAHVWRDHQCVRVVQIPGPVSGLPANFRAIVENTNPDYRRERSITVIHAKDVAKPEDLDDAAASTWVKMTRPSFEAFKIAFLDPESRIRLGLADKPHSALEALTIHGGYLGGVDARFSDNLNALIGGRGAGKSTLVECVRYALELAPVGKQAQKLHQDILKENLGKHAGVIELWVRSAAQQGKRFKITRRFGEPPIVQDASGAVSRQTPRDLLPQVEVYGQNEIFELAQDDAGHARLIERFVPLDRHDAEAHAELQRRIADNTHRFVKARTDLDEILERVGRLPKLGEQLKGFQDTGIEAKLAHTPLLARERQVVERIQQELERVDRAIDGLAESMPDLTFLSDKALEGLPNVTQLVAMRRGIEGLRDELVRHGTVLRAAAKAGRASLEPHTLAWQAAVQAGERDLERALSSLPDMAGKSGREVGAAYRQLTLEIERIKPLEAKKEAHAQLVGNLEQERANLLAELSDLRRSRATKLVDAVDGLNRRLKGKLRIDLRVEGNRGPLKKFLVDCKLDGVGEKRLDWIEERDVTPLALVRALRGGVGGLAAEYGVTPVVAEALANLSYSKVLELEAIELTDYVGIQLNVSHGDAEQQYKDMTRLSTGQQCTAVLHLLLLENNDPLIVDQPEDNLDNAFIAERIVRELREAKAHRQFLFSTHNANIPVFGDAEWIGVLTADRDHGAIEPGHQGSIDVAYIRQQAAEILEGGRAAFTQRKEMYEF